MKKTVKTESLMVVFNILKNAKYSKMTDGDKVSVWKIFRAIKKIGKSFEDDAQDLSNKLMPYETFMDDLQKAREYEIAKSKGENYIDITEDEYKEFIVKLQKYNKTVDEAIREISEKEVEVEFEPLKDDAFDRLCMSNDWTLNQADIVGEFVCEAVA